MMRMSVVGVVEGVTLWALCKSCKAMTSQWGCRHEWRRQRTTILKARPCQHSPSMPMSSIYPPRLDSPFVVSFLFPVLYLYRASSLWPCCMLYQYFLVDLLMLEVQTLTKAIKEAWR